jgi:hypothetical protein
MIRLEEVTIIEPPIERCFDLSPNAVIKHLAQSSGWSQYLPSSSTEQQSSHQITL